MGRPPPSLPRARWCCNVARAQQRPPQPLHSNRATEAHRLYSAPVQGCAALAVDEVGTALTRSTPSSAPGPDMTPNSVWKRIHQLALHLIHELLAPLLANGFHHPALEMADSIVLDKLVKPSNDSPSSFRVILLLQTISKILQRIRNSRLSCVACLAGLLNPHQCGSLAGLSVSDATTTLAHTLRTLEMAGNTVSTLFLDIKSGFDTVDPSALCSMLKVKAVNPYLISRTRSSLTAMTCQLSYQWSPKAFAPVSVPTPQGSPVSPLLFVIYVSRLHCEIPQGRTLSYFNDFGLTVSSTSDRHNIQSLQRH